MIYVTYFSNNGLPAAGLTPTISVCKKVSDGSDVVSPPAIIELGDGFYKFTATPTEALVVQIDGGSALAAADRYKVVQITPHDPDLDAPVSSRASADDLNGLVAEFLAGDLSDGQTLTQNSLADLIRKIFWFICNRMEVVDISGAWSVFKNDGTTVAGTGTFTDNSVKTVRTQPLWS